jgi:hypothetical protein
VLVGLSKELLPRLTQDALREAVRELKNDQSKKLEWVEIVAKLLEADSDVAPLLIKETIAAGRSS